jgi:diguanylate cyclase (GGDEF)-like protein
MKLQAFRASRNSAALMSRLVGWAAILMTGTVLFGAGVVYTIGQAANEDALRKERWHVTALLDEHTDRLAELVERAVEQQDTASERVQIFHNLAAYVDLAGIVDTGSDGIHWVDLRRYAAVRIDEALVASQLLVNGSRRGRRDAGASGSAARGELQSDEYMVQGYVVHDGAFIFAASHPLDNGRLVLGLRHFDPVSPEASDAFSPLRDFTVGRMPFGPDRNGITFEDRLTGDTLFLSWVPERPGDVLMRRIAMAAIPPLSITLLLFLLVVFNTRRVAQELAESQARTESLAGRDPLSGLPNRLLFGQTLDAALSIINTNTEGGRERGFSLMFLDLDRFKDVNDAHGHQAGDELIKQVAGRLLTILRAKDTLARFGGDEFAILQTDVTDSEDARSLAGRILHALSEPFELSGNTVNVGVSIGIAMAPRDAADRETLMRMADTALYEAKSEGRNRSAFFHQQMDEALQMRKVVADDLRRAIAENELTIHYQPIYSADGTRIVSLEALVRWPHPTKGMISPAKFIPLAEQSGLVIPLGEWVVRRVCQDGMRWPGVRIAVNVSPIQFRQRDFVDSVISVVAEAGFEPERLELELTEGVVVEDADAAEVAMRRLRDHGFPLALDDFGTGYSSLIYLRRFAFDKIKIDRSFLDSLDAAGESAILVHSIVHLGRALGLKVTAEGVETKEQHRFLQALGCHEMQGFLFSRPVCAQEVDLLLGLGPRRLEAQRVSAA